MRILILCTGNSCRSQMAHGIISSLRSDYEVCSAGTFPAQQVNPYATKVMHEIGIDISSHTPTNVADYLAADWDYVITVCGNADETCPTFDGRVAHRLHIGFEDPAEATGTEEEILSRFRLIRDQIRRRMQLFLTEIL